MHSKLITTALFALTLFSVPALARQAVPIVNLDNVAVVAKDTKKPSTAQVLEAIKAASTKQDWVITDAEDGSVNATILVRQKHTVVVNIKYNAEKYSIHYQSSINMKYEKTSNGEIIHPFYNRWVSALNDGIQLELNR